MNQTTTKIIKSILYLGLFFLFFALTILIGMKMNESYSRGNSYRHILWCVSLSFVDISTIILMIYWMSKIPISFLTINDEIKKNKILNISKLILYFGLIFLFLGLTIYIARCISAIQLLIFVFPLAIINIAIIILMIYWISKFIILILFIKNEIAKNRINSFFQPILYFGLMLLFLGLTFFFEIGIIVAIVNFSWSYFFCFGFFDIFAILVIIYFILKIIFSLYTTIKSLQKPKN